MAETDYQPSESAALISFNDDLLTEILLRLPAASIIGFKSVSKHWLSLLSHRSFTLLYDKLLISPGLIVCDFYIPFDVENQNTRPSFRVLDFHPDPSGIKIVQSCNGLLLCCKERQRVSHTYYVINPTTNLYAVIPPAIGGPYAGQKIRFMGLAFHPTDCVHYKLICFLGKDLLQIQIYSSDKRKWKILNHFYSGTYYTTFSFGVYWNGAVHWAPSCTNPYYFQLDIERLQKLPFPTRIANSGGYINNGCTPLYFGESRGHLHMVEPVDHHNALHMIVYEMLSDHSGWFVKYLVKFDEFPTTYPEMIYYYPYDPCTPIYDYIDVFDVVRGEEERDTFIVVRIQPVNKVIRYNVADKSFKLIMDIPDASATIDSGKDVHRLIETLGPF